MFGCTRTGCFIMGVVLGFLLASALVLFCLFQLNPSFREKTVTGTRQIWIQVKGGIDDAVGTEQVKPPPPPPPEPAVPVVKRDRVAPGPAPAAPRTAPRSAEQVAPRPVVPPGPQPPARGRTRVNL